MNELKTMLNVAVFHSGRMGAEKAYSDSAEIKYHYFPTTKDFNPDLSPFDVLITGNDHIAMQKIKPKIKKFLDNGNTLLCFSGWFTNYIPGNQWVMERDIKTIDMRYFKGEDKYGLLHGVDIDELIFMNGISGWWACGHIEASSNADAFLVDTLKRPIGIIDEKTTNGKIICTAGGPLSGRRSNPDKPHAANILFENIIEHILKTRKNEKENRAYI